ncbi:MAG: sugar ABC transporter permease [Sulfobacillus benefaciens]|uniref:Sugar ABC transporter permease n=1 Tax=Sulfobacillus benefaciens TaxID=453960 RepID=A0A2T2XCW2_9FIRM|nr:MAG: sugar ABC transporter permease [Sulfobacillus benefaciens]
MKMMTPYLLVLPAMAVILGLVIYPLIFSVFSSLHVDNLLYPSIHTFVGWKNYQQVLSDPSFQIAVRNTGLYFIFATVGILLFGLTISSWLHSIPHRWRGLFLTIVILPWAVPGVVTGLLWSFIYNPTSGILDGALTSLHIISHNIIWFNHTSVSLILITIALLWQIVPLASIILLAGLESIPPTIYEAATVDGCPPVRRFFRITLPLLRPSLAIVLVQTAVLSIGIFDQVYVLTGYDPSTKSAVIQTYLYAFQNLNFGQGISAALIITLGITVVGYLYLRLIYREVAY